MVQSQHMGGGAATRADIDLREASAALPHKATPVAADPPPVVLVSNGCFVWHLDVHCTQVSGPVYSVKVALIDDATGRVILMCNPNTQMTLDQEHMLPLFKGETTPHDPDHGAQMLPQDEVYEITSMKLEVVDDTNCGGIMGCKLYKNEYNKLVFAILNTKVQVDWIIGARDIVPIDA